MADLMTEIEIRISNYILPTEFVQALEELGWKINEAIRAEINSMEMF